MKKLLFGILLALGLMFAPISIKAEPTTTEIPNTTQVPEETEEPKEETPEEVEDEVTIEDVENKINDLIVKLEDAGYLDETDFGKWFEKNTGIAISVVISFVVGMLGAALIGIKAAKNVKEVFNNSDKLSNKVDKTISNANALLDKYQETIKKLIEENAKLTDEFKAYVEKANLYVDEVQAKVDKNRESLIKLADSIDEVISNEETVNNTREI